MERAAEPCSAGVAPVSADSVREACPFIEERDVTVGHFAKQGLHFTFELRVAESKSPS